MLLFNEVEIVLEVLGVAAAGNFLAKKLLFAKDREQTVEQIRCVVLCGSAFYHYYLQLQELELHQVVNSKAAGVQRRPPSVCLSSACVQYCVQYAVVYLCSLCAGILWTTRSQPVRLVRT